MNNDGYYSQEIASHGQKLDELKREIAITFVLW